MEGKGVKKRNSTARRLAWALAASSALVFALGIIRVASMEVIEWRIYPEFIIATTLAGFSLSFLDTIIEVNS